ncbi:MAG: 2-oxoacid:acceptor oxidoreductase family protein [Firmicutes bacterium]|nr:2-oxoacid:acceptor oxidoreductase family protein [Bacillota bacterium]MBQ6662973.1 2-oxoacid:acceptor oxidoreductase family protein [Bacillota bacterium]MCR4711573.1 2-oxoacid:acceptor oxidoreductase family protein [Clostridia bacterium]
MKEIIFAGFGGQGVLTGGLVLAYIASKLELNPVWMPAYGPSMRGGKANSTVKFGDSPEEKVGNPAMDNADVLIAMNEPSLEYIEFCKPGATVFINSHSVPADYKLPDGFEEIRIDCVELAEAVGNAKGANLVMAAAVIKHCKLFDEQFALEQMCAFFAEKGKEKFNKLNIAAFQAGYDVVE